jgi:multimeric flavodoxin WrbA
MSELSPPHSSTFIILGTSRPRGNTRLLVDTVFPAGVALVDLSERNVSAYDYEHRNSGDDFLPIITQLLASSTLILATPVYWYTMSAQLKTFVDRTSDLLHLRKDLGLELRGKAIAVLASGIEECLPEGFEQPFSLTCNYLGMRYLGAAYGRFERDGVPAHGALDRARQDLRRMGVAS